MELQAIGIPWYKRENFNELVKLFDDGHKLHDTYPEWLASANSLRREIESKGMGMNCIWITQLKTPPNSVGNMYNL